MKVKWVDIERAISDYCISGKKNPLIVIHPDTELVGKTNKRRLICLDPMFLYDDGFVITEFYEFIRFSNLVIASQPNEYQCECCPLWDNVNGCMSNIIDVFECAFTDEEGNFDYYCNDDFENIEDCGTGVIGRKLIESEGE